MGLPCSRLRARRAVGPRSGGAALRAREGSAILDTDLAKFTIAKSCVTAIRSGATKETSRTIVVTAVAIGLLLAGMYLGANSIW
jgi:hypothetical protein